MAQGASLPLGIAVLVFAIGLSLVWNDRHEASLVGELYQAWELMGFLYLIGLMGGGLVSLPTFIFTSEVFRPKGAHRLLGCFIFIVMFWVVLAI